MNKELKISDKMDELISYSKAHAIAMTEQRLAVYRILASSGSHPSPEEIYQELKEKYPTLSLATVYKNLEALAKIGFAHKINPLTDHLRYDANLKPHGHFICMVCRNIEDIFQDKPKAPFPLKGYKIIESSMQYIGICKSCLRQSQEEK